MDINEIEDEVRAEFLEALANCAKFWAEYPNKTSLERCNGMAFSFLCMFDSGAFDAPPLALFSPCSDEVEDGDKDECDVCAGYVRIGNGGEMHAEYFKGYAPRVEPQQVASVAVAKSFVSRLRNLLFGRR